MREMGIAAGATPAQINRGYLTLAFYTNVSQGILMKKEVVLYKPQKDIIEELVKRKYFVTEASAIRAAINELGIRYKIVRPDKELPYV